MPVCRIHKKAGGYSYNKAECGVGADQMGVSWLNAFRTLSKIKGNNNKALGKMHFWCVKKN